MNRIPLWPFAVVLFLIAVAVTLHAEGPELERGQEIACEAELCDYSCASACELSRLSREVESLTDTIMGTDPDATDRTHVVQDRSETSTAIIDTMFQVREIHESSHLVREAVGAAGVCSASHPSPIIMQYPRAEASARPAMSDGRA